MYFSLNVSIFLYFCKNSLVTFINMYKDLYVLLKFINLNAIFMNFQQFSIIIHIIIIIIIIFIYHLHYSFFLVTTCERYELCRYMHTSEGYAIGQSCPSALAIGIPRNIFLILQLLGYYHFLSQHRKHVIIFLVSL